MLKPFYEQLIVGFLPINFDAEGITIPFPQRDVHMYKAE